MNKFKEFFYALLKVNQGRAKAFAIARHIAFIVLYEKKGLINKLYPDFRTKAEMILSKFPEIQIVSTLRTFKQQDGLYAQGRTAPGRVVTNAKGGQSYHNYCLAFDFNFRDTGWDSPRARWEKVGKYAESIGCTWGGRFNDLGHIQFDRDVTWQELIKFFDGGK